MKSKALMISLCVVLLLSLSGNIVSLVKFSGKGAAEEEFIMYRPVFFNPIAKDLFDEYMINRNAMTTEHLERVKVVLDHYGKPYRIDGGMLFVERALWEDKKVIADITRKADDMEWLIKTAGYDPTARRSK